MVDDDCRPALGLEGQGEISLSPQETKLGLRAAPTSHLAIDGLDLPGEALVGARGKARPIIEESFAQFHVAKAAVAVGLAQASLKVALDYSKLRQQFGTFLCKHPALAGYLADSAAQVEAARWLTYRAATFGGEPAKKGALAAMAALRACEAAVAVADRALQIHGGYGYSREFLPELYYRNAQALRVTATLPDSLRTVIADELVGEV